MSNYLTTKQRYDLSATEIPHNHNQSIDGMVCMDVDLVCSTTVGNLDSYSRNIEDKVLFSITVSPRLMMIGQDAQAFTYSWMQA